MTRIAWVARIALLPCVIFGEIGRVFGAEEPSHDDDHNSHDSGYDSGHGSDHEGEHDEYDSVFILGEHFDYRSFVYLLAIFGVAVLFLEYALEKYEDYLNITKDHFEETLYHKIVRELMILGFVSFGLFLLEPLVPTGDYLIFFEVTHYVIFLIAVFSVVQVILLGVTTFSIKRQWDAAAYKTKREVMEGYASAKQGRSKFMVTLPLVGYIALDPLHLAKDRDWISHTVFHLSRSVFIRMHNHKPNFDFAKFAIKVTDGQILDMAKTPITSWVVLIVLQWIGYAASIQDVDDKGRKLVKFYEWFFFGVTLLLIEVALLGMCMLGARRVLVKLGASKYDPYRTLDDVINKYWVTPRTHTQQARVEKYVALKGEAGFSKVLSSADVPDRCRDVGMGGEMGKHTDDLPMVRVRDAFLVDTTRYHKGFIEVLMLLNSYYLAFYAIYFVAQALEEPSTYFWIIVLPAPILLGVVVAYRRMLPIYALLAAVVENDIVAADKVSKESDIADKVRRKVVTKVQEKLSIRIIERRASKVAAGHPLRKTCMERDYAELLLEEWDLNHDKTIDTEELLRGLENFEVNLTFQQQREFMRLADPDRSGSIDVLELADLLYDIGQEREWDDSRGAGAGAGVASGDTSSNPTQITEGSGSAQGGEVAVHVAGGAGGEGKGPDTTA